MNVVKLFRPTALLTAAGAMLLLSLAGPASSEGYGDPVIVPGDGGTTEVEPGGSFEVTFSANVECAWTARFVDQSAPGAVGFDYAATFNAPTAAGTYTGTVVCRFSATGPFRPVAYSPDAVDAAGRDQTTTQTFTVVVAGDAANDGPADKNQDNVSDKDDAAADNASRDSGALADTGGDNWQLLALGAGFLVVGGGVAVAARRRKTA